MPIIANMLFCFCGSYLLARHMPKFDVMDISYFTILYYSKLQIFIKNQLNNHKMITYFFRSINNLFMIKNTDDIILIKNNQVIHTLNSRLEREVIDKPFDFLIYSDKENDSSVVNKCILYDIPDEYSYNICKYKFFSLVMVFSEEEKYNIKLSSSFENYYIENNRINTELLFYLLSKQYGVYKNEDEKYILYFIDQLFSEMSISEEAEILLGIDSYEIRRFTSNNNHSDESSEEDTKSSEEDTKSLDQSAKALDQSAKALNDEHYDQEQDEHYDQEHDEHYDHYEKEIFLVNNESITSTILQEAESRNITDSIQFNKEEESDSDNDSELLVEERKDNYDPYMVHWTNKLFI